MPDNFPYSQFTFNDDLSASLSLIEAPLPTIDVTVTYATALTISPARAELVIQRSSAYLRLAETDRWITAVRLRRLGLFVPLGPPQDFSYELKYRTPGPHHKVMLLIKAGAQPLIDATWDAGTPGSATLAARDAFSIPWVQYLMVPELLRKFWETVDLVA